MTFTLTLISSLLGLIGAFGLLAPAARAARPHELSSTPGKRVHLVELFSSEGCSSCPPAEEWMGTLKSDPRLWTEFVPVEFHVDYWNKLGWIDRFSKSAFTTREYDYASTWGKESVYTPTRVRDGEEWNGSGWGSWPVTAFTGSLKATARGSRQFDIAYDGAGEGLELNAVLLGRGLTTEVKSGENSGRTLRHEFVALSYMKAPWKGPAHVTLPAPPESAKPESYAAAFWISRVGSPVPLQAAGGDLAAGEY